MGVVPGVQTDSINNVVKRALQYLAPLCWLGGWVYLGLLLGAVFFLLFIESLHYIYLIALPIPVLVPVYLWERLYGWRLSGFVYLLAAVLALGALLAGRVWLDLLYPTGFLFEF